MRKSLRRANNQAIRPMPGVVPTSEYRAAQQLFNREKKTGSHSKGTCRCGLAKPVRWKTNRDQDRCIEEVFHQKNEAHKSRKRRVDLEKMPSRAKNYP